MTEILSMWEKIIRKKDVCQGHLNSLPRRPPSVIPHKGVWGTLQEHSPSRRITARQSAPSSTHQSGKEEIQGGNRKTEDNSGKRKLERGSKVARQRRRVESSSSPPVTEVLATKVEIIEVQGASPERFSSSCYDGYYG